MEKSQENSKNLSYANIYTQWFTFDNKKYLRVFAAQHRAEFLKMYNYAYLTKEDTDDTNYENDIQVFIIAGDLINILIDDIDKYMSLFTPDQKQLAKGIWEIGSQSTFQDNLLAFIEKRIEYYKNDYNEKLAWHEHIKNMKQLNITKNDSIRYEDKTIYFDDCETDNSGNYLIAAGTMIRFFEVIYMILNVYYKDFEKEVANNNTTSTIDEDESPFIFKNDHILSKDSHVEISGKLIQDLYIAFFENKVKKPTHFSTFQDIIYNCIKEYIVNTNDNLDGEYTSNTDYALLDDVYGDFKETVVFNGDYRSGYTPIVPMVGNLKKKRLDLRDDDESLFIGTKNKNNNFNDYSKITCNTIPTDNCKQQIKSIFGYNVNVLGYSLSSMASDEIIIDTEKKIINVPIQQDTYETYKKIAHVFSSANINDLLVSDKITLDEILNSIKPKHITQYLLLNQFTQRLKFSSEPLHDYLNEYKCLYTTSEINDESLKLLDTLCTVLQEVNTSAHIAEIIQTILTASVHNKVILTETPTKRHLSCDFCKVGLVKQKSLIHHFVHIYRDKHPKFENTWTSSAGLCANILKYLENINKVQSFPINKNQISIHLEEAGIAKKRTGEGNKFESTEPQPDDITFIVNDVVAKIKK